MAWIADIEAYTPGAKIDYPIIADPDRKLAVQWGMLDPDEVDQSGEPLAARAVFIIGPDKRLKLAILYPATTGRNFNEVRDSNLDLCTYIHTEKQTYGHIDKYTWRQIDI